MYINDFSIKEVNAYYARRGGIRTAKIGSYANIGSFADIMRQTTTQRTAAARESQAEAARESASTQSAQDRQTAARTQSQSHTHTALHSDATAQTRQAAQSNTAGQSRQTVRNSTALHTSQASEKDSTVGEGNICCDKCQLTNQLLVQMMSRNLYSQSALGYPLTGSVSWMAYQNMANVLNSGLYS